MEGSKRNLENRAVQIMNHTVGTKRFAQMGEEKLVDRASEDALRPLNERVSQQPESLEREVVHGMTSSPK
ncbi:hypothetical protein AAC387_Pa02g1706 [Persea americana]